MDKGKDTLIKILVEIARVVLGITFVFSGFVKAVDPYGTAYKIEDYLTAFNLSSLSFSAFGMSVVLCVMEFLMGAFMLLGIYRRWNSRLILLTMCFMTPLTLYLAIANPVSDCGCFGDAFIISNWETFFKNIILLACAIFVSIYCERISFFFTGKTYWLVFLYTIIFSFSFVFYNYVFDPIFDFRPYKIGANIPEEMSVEEGKGRVEETMLIYGKDGKEETFTDQNAPWEDPSWEFVRMETKLISEGIAPQIKDFSITQLQFNRERDEVLDQVDITEEVLSDTNYVFLMISPLLKNIGDSYLSNFEDVADYAREYHYKFYCLTASGSDDIIKWAEENTVDFAFCNTDERALKTIIRTNPGLLLIKNGIVYNKWADIRVPAEENLTAPLEYLSYGQPVDIKAKEKSNLIYVAVLFMLPLFLLVGLDSLIFRRRKIDQIQDTKEKEADIN